VSGRFRFRPDAHGDQRPDGEVTSLDARDLSACFQCSARSDDIIAPSGRVELVVRTHTAINGRMVKLPVRTSATCPLVSNAVHVRTTLLHRLDGDPTSSIKAPGHRIFTLPHQNLSFWHLVINFLRAFGFILVLVFLLIILPF
jgi:hypothetical protein